MTAKVRECEGANVRRCEGANVRRCESAWCEVSKPMTMIRICVVVLVFGATACTKNNATTATTAASTRTTDTFTGTVQVAGSDSHGFTVS